MHDNSFDLWITLNKEYFVLSLVEIALEVFEKKISKVVNCKKIHFVAIVSP